MFSSQSCFSYFFVTVEGLNGLADLKPCFHHWTVTTFKHRFLRSGSQDKRREIGRDKGIFRGTSPGHPYGYGYPYTFIL